MAKDYYVQPDALDAVLNDEKVLWLVRQHVPEAKEVTGVDETGGEARTYAIDETLIFKTQHPAGAAASQRAVLWRRLAGGCALAYGQLGR